MKRNFVRSVLAVLFGLAMGAVPAMAQVAFTASSTLLPVRGEGTKEAVGQIVLGATTAGTIIGGTAAAPGSAIVVTFSAPIANASTVGSANVKCLPTTNCGGLITAVSASGSVMTIKFPTSNVLMAVGNSYTISGLRINASALATPTLTANITATIPPAVSSTNPITITNPTVTIANVAKPSFTTALTVGPSSILTCNPASGENTFAVTVTENYQSAFTSASDEAGLTPPPTVITNGVQFLFTVTNVPSGATLTANASVSSASFPLLKVAEDSTTACAAGVTSTGAPITCLYDINGDDPTVIENFLVAFTTDFHGMTLPSSPPPPAVTVGISLAPTDQTKTPAFVAGNSEGNFTAITISPCVTYLLLPWVTNYQVASCTDPRCHYDTGIVIGNTTTDPFGAPGSALPQNGNCVLTLYPWDGSASTTYTTATANSGTSLLFTASTAFPGKSGYVAGLCNFQNAHSYVYIVDNSGLGPAHTAADYLGLVIPNPTLVDRNSVV